MSTDHANSRHTRFGDVIQNINEKFSVSSSPALPYVAGLHIEEGARRIRRYGRTDEPEFPPTFRRMFRPGDVLLHSRNISKVAVCDRTGVTGEKLFVLRSGEPGTVIQDYIPWLLLSDDLQHYCVQHFSGSVNKFLNWQPLASCQIYLPSITNQRRIADTMWAAEDAWDANLVATERARETEIAVLREVYDDQSWPVRRVAEAGDVQLGLKREPKVHSGSHPRPYLRVANVGDDELSLDDVLIMNFNEKDFERYRLRSGDILLNEGQSLELVGRCAMYADEIPDCCFQMTLLRFRCGTDLIPDFAYGWFRRCFHLGVFSRVAARTTSMAHLTARIFAGLSIPVPPLDVQRIVVERVEAVRQLRRRLTEHERTARNLRRQLLSYLLAERP